QRCLFAVLSDIGTHLFQPILKIALPLSLGPAPDRYKQSVEHTDISLHYYLYTTPGDNEAGATLVAELLPSVVKAHNSCSFSRVISITILSLGRDV
ncbi:MAG: hypothetical protein ACK559_37175, partial [bacterium]